MGTILPLCEESHKFLTRCFQLYNGNTPVFCSDWQFKLLIIMMIEPFKITFKIFYINSNISVQLKIIHVKLYQTDYTVH